jgi:hypothetical protein
VNPTTAAATLIGAGSYSYIFSLVFTNNTMYAIDDFFVGSGIYSVNLANGQSTLLANYDTSVIGGIEGAATFNPASVPEPSCLVLGGIASAAIGLGWGRRRIAKRDKSNHVR